VPEPSPRPPLPLSVWPTAQHPAAAQRTGRYLPGSTAHPAKMLPTIARQAIAAYSHPGDLVLDPMCGIGTTLVEAIHLGRQAIGIELEPRWAQLASANLTHARYQGATGTATVLTGDARQLPRLVDPDLGSRTGIRFRRLAGLVGVGGR
jgi:modification methylase